MDDPVSLASQPANSYPIIFQYPTEIPIPLFVEASKIPERPKLIRSLIVSGSVFEYCRSLAEIQGHLSVMGPPYAPLPQTHT